MDKNELEKLLIEVKTNREIAIILNKSKSTISYNVKKLNLTHLYKYKKPEYNNENYIYVEHNEEYYKECVENLKQKGGKDTIYKLICV